MLLQPNHYYLIDYINNYSGIAKFAGKVSIDLEKNKNLIDLPFYISSEQEEVYFYRKDIVKEISSDEVFLLLQKQLAGELLQYLQNTETTFQIKFSDAEKILLLEQTIELILEKKITPYPRNENDPRKSRSHNSSGS